MEKDVWKWIFGELTDKSLIHLVYSINETLTGKSRITIKGISDISKIKSDQIRLFRNRLEQEINKPKNILKAKMILRSKIVKNYRNIERIARLSENETAEIWREIQISEDINFSEMITYLMSSTDESKFNKGMELFNQFYIETVQNNEEVNCESEESKIVGETKVKIEEVMPINEVSNNIDEQVQTLQKEIQILNETNLVLNNKIQEQEKGINSLVEEKKQVVKINKDLKRKISQVEGVSNELNKNIQKQERELLARKTEILNRDKKIQELQDVLKKTEEIEISLQLEIDGLIRKINEIEIEKTNIANQKEAQFYEKEEMAPKREITIIDRNMPDGLSSQNSLSINMIKPNDLEHMILSQILDKSDEIWFMKFKLPVAKQNILKEKYGEKVTGFNNYNELKSYFNIKY